MDRMKKKVGILLRVSTSTQAKQNNNEEDIPTQRTACTRFIESHPDWAFEKEYMEIGVSGFKNLLNDRDKLLEVRADIQNGVINVLVVFMFDRLGRVEEETPFVLKSFVDMGCEVWSVREGQRKFEAHVDNLLNYLTFWQAAGESKRTSERVTAAMSQMAESGQYLGGKLPYGYCTVETGRVTKKKLPEKTLVIDEKEAEVVRTIFHLALTQEYGCHRIARYLNERGVPSKQGKQWGHAAIANILRNPIYKGVKAYNRTTAKGLGRKQIRTDPNTWIFADHNPDWEIVPTEVWDQIQQGIEIKRQKISEQKEHNDAEHVNLGRTKLLLVGYTYCGYCGAKMSAGYSPYRWKTQDGVARRRYNPVYRCYSVASGKIGCKGKTSYKKELIEDTVVEDVLNHLETLKTVDLTKEISRLKKENVSVEEKTLKTLQKEIEKTTKERTLLEGEVVKAIAGESSFDKDMLARMINEKTTRLSELERSVLDTGEILQLKRIEYSDMVRLQKMIPVWRKEYEDADFEAKKVLLSKIIERVTIFRDKIQVKLRLQITDYGKANAVHKPSGSASGDSCYLDDNADLSIIGINRRPDRYR